MVAPSTSAPAVAGGGSVVALAGSRRLSPAAAPLVERVTLALVRAGRSLAVGCCVGADEFVLSAVAGGRLPADRVRVFAVFGPVSPPFRAWRFSAPGACRLSAVNPVAGALLAGASVSWWAGGGPSVPLPARLSSRTSAVLGVANGGLVVFPVSAGSRGSLGAAHQAAHAGLPVVAFPMGFPASQLPSLGSGCWVPAASRGLWANGWRWQSATLPLFSTAQG